MLDRTGVLAAITAYAAWGFVPIYWQMLKHISALETMSHRVIWSLLFYAGAARLRGTLNQAGPLMRSKKVLSQIALGSVFIAINWLVYVWSVTHGHVMETSLGYFINPLINVAIGALILRERLTMHQKVALAFATIGVLWIAIEGGRPPWIALGLAGSFAIYGLVKRAVRGDATAVSFVETLVLFPMAIVAAISIRSYGPESSLSLLQTPSTLSGFEWTLLVAGGVITGIPLLFFGVAAQRLPLSALGFFQFLSPSLQFLSAVFFFHEPLNTVKLIGFLLIWLGLAIYLKGIRSKSSETKNPA